MKAFYGFFVDKINFPDLSENVKQILNYFNDTVLNLVNGTSSGGVKFSKSE